MRAYFKSEVGSRACVGLFSTYIPETSWALG